MPHVQANNLTIAYESYGSLTDPAIVLIAGLGSQLITWPSQFIDGFVTAGLRVVVFDNRDVGKSTWLDDLGKVDFKRIEAEGKAPYTLWDMANDTVGLLDMLNIESAHILGVSLGGMIGQCIASAYPERASSLVSIMSTTGNPAVGKSTEVANKYLMRAAPADREGYIQHTWERFQVVGATRRYPESAQYIRERAAASFDRAFHPEGNARQLVTVPASGDRTESLRKVMAPTLVIHGTDDVLIDISGGRATANAVEKAELFVVEGMGHHLAQALIPSLLDPILDTVHSV